MKLCTSAQLRLVDVGADVERVASHLLRAQRSGGRWVVSALRSAAAQSMAQGATDTAVAQLRRALAEPPALDVRADVLAELGRAEGRAGEPTGPDRLRESLELVQESHRRGNPAGRAGQAAQEAGGSPRPPRPSSRG